MGYFLFVGMRLIVSLQTKNPLHLPLTFQQNLKLKLSCLYQNVYEN